MQHLGIRVVAVVMAAGNSRRFGTADKRRARLADGRTLLAASVSSVAEVFGECRVVLREGDDPLASELPPPVQAILAPHADEGLGASLADAFAVLERDPQLQDCLAAAVLLGDMPFIANATLRMLLDEAEPSRIVRPRQDGRPGHPVLFGRDFWPYLQRLDGDEGARAIVRRHRDRLKEIDVDDAGIHIDIDTPSDMDADAIGTIGGSQ